MRYLFLFFLVLALPRAWAQKPKENNALEDLARAFENELSINGFKANVPPPKIVVDSQPLLSYYRPEENVVHTSNWAALSPQYQQGISVWASLAQDGTTEEKLFADMFHRFFLTHELAHWAQDQGPSIDSNHLNRFEHETQANRISVAYRRGKDPVYLAKLVDEFRDILNKLPSPLPQCRS